MINGLEEKKGEDILLLDIQGIASFADYFIVCSGSSDRMLDSLANSVLQTAKQQFNIHTVVEGNPGSGWLVIDLGDIVVHLFSPDQRDYYRLEQLWDKGKVLLHLQ
ncbi:MAG: ribosome silencing factor [Chloroflexi bacterium]|nr:ribosome silencing factor [Chloroflexota bacterium]